jgi:hypothetical protein
MAAIAWEPHPDLEPYLVEEVRKAVDSLPPLHVLPPRDGEIYDNPSAALDHLQEYAMTKRFVVVQRSREADRWRWQCIAST